MKDSHAHLNITEQEWDRMVVIFKEVLTKHQVPGPEQEGLLDIVGSTRADIVTAGTKR
jgi:hemoglobin